MFPTRSAMIRFGGKAGFEALVGGFRNTVETANKSIEARYPQIEKAEIQGTTPHSSAKDPSDPKKVITISYHTEKGTRLLSIHAHDDGTWNEFFSRVNLPVLLLLRALPLPTSHGGQTSRPTVQNGGMARNGLKEIGLMSIKNGMLVTMANGTIGNIVHGFENIWVAQVALPYT